MGVTHIIVRLLIVVPVLAEIVLVVIFVVEVALEFVLIKGFERKSLAGEPVDGARDDLLLDVLTQLVVKLKLILNVGGGVVVFLGRSLRGGEEVEEGFRGHGLLDDASLLGVCGKGVLATTW